MEVDCKLSFSFQLYIYVSQKGRAGSMLSSEGQLKELYKKHVLQVSYLASNFIHIYFEWRPHLMKTLLSYCCRYSDHFDVHTQECSQQMQTTTEMDTEYQINFSSPVQAYSNMQ